jgi:peptide/nickel transport system substrate-binding protein
MRADTAPLNDVRVRQALRLMVDREQMISAAYAGRADVGNDVYGRWDPTYAGESFPQRQQDIDQAKSLLRQAGQEGLSLELVTAPIAAGVVEASTVFAQQAKAAGVTVNIRKLPAGSYYNAPWPYPFGVDIWGTPLYFFVAASATGPQAASAFNSAHWRNPRWDKLYKEAIGQVDLKKRTELSTEMQRIEHDEGGWIVWGFPNWVDGVSKRIAGVPKGKFQMPLGDLRFASIGLVS